MLKFLDNLPQNTVGLEVNGEVTKDEYDSIVVPKMEQLANQQGEINYIVVLKSGITSFTTGVWWDDFKMAVKHYSKWNKIAVVTDQQLVENVTNIFGFVFPGQHRVFKLNELDEAITWASGK